MSLRGAAAIVVTAMAVAACGGSSTSTTPVVSSTAYPVNVQTNYLNACEEGASTSVCQCTLNHIETSVSLSSFQAADAAVDNGATEPTFATNAIAACSK